MNLREFYKVIFAQNTFNSDKIKANALAGKYIKHRPYLRMIILGVSLILISLLILLFITMDNNKNEKEGLSLIGRSISMLTPQERLERSRLIYKQQSEKNANELTKFLITFNSPMTVSNAKEVLKSIDKDAKIDYFYIKTLSDEFLIKESEFYDKFSEDSVSLMATGAIISTLLKNYNDFQAYTHIYSVEISQSQEDIDEFKPINPQYNIGDKATEAQTPNVTAPPTSQSEQTSAPDTSISVQTSTTPPVMPIPSDFKIELESNIHNAYFLNNNILCVISNKTHLYKYTENSFIKIKELDNTDYIFMQDNNMIITASKTQNTGMITLNKLNLLTNEETTLSGVLPDSSMSGSKILFNTQTQTLILKANIFDETAVYYAKINSGNSNIELNLISESNINIIGMNEREIFYQNPYNQQKNNVIFSFNIRDMSISEKLSIEQKITAVSNNENLNFSYISTDKNKYLFIANNAELIEINSSQNSKISKNGDYAIIGNQIIKLENSEIIKTVATAEEISSLFEYNSTKFKISATNQNVIYLSLRQ